MVVKGFSLKFFYGLVCLVVFSLGSGARVGGAFEDTPGGIKVEVKGFEFDSYAGFLDWLMEREAEGAISAEELGEILDQLPELEAEGMVSAEESGESLDQSTEEIVPQQACLSASSNPPVVNVAVPAFIKVAQIFYTVQTIPGQCGLVLCADMFFDFEWVNPPSPSATILFPTIDFNVCVGNPGRATIYVVLIKGVDPGTYTLNFTGAWAGGGATASTVFNVHE